MTDQPANGQAQVPLNTAGKVIAANSDFWRQQALALAMRVDALSLDLTEARQQLDEAASLIDRLKPTEQAE